MSVPESARKVAQAVRAAMGGEPEVYPFYDEDESHSVDIVQFADRPEPGYSSYSTLTLHLSENLLDGSDVRVELCGVAPSGVTEFPNVLATAALFVMKDGWLCAPGVVFPNLVAEYGLSTSLRHLLWVEPFPWSELGRVEIDGGPDVHWLLAIPISDSERELLERDGLFALEQRFSELEVAYFDLDREPIPMDRSEPRSGR